ncbi:hypothetical protein SY94_3607 [Agrobacterium tumefaciens]|nr:hypothetical protein SY94_3607 [Agrobacterium tumefaciens]
MVVRKPLALGARMSRFNPVPVACASRFCEALTN